ncbi:AbrB/MazE/SpoVT family DNA-binding domain-containing protein [Falsiroseomonas sp. E2-1-a20]|uniref:AbrB/MazE/SpoVT family DNA-binding domain-containing protein n=1 Tax=Falsiroseomonas sp. E2-1-a20 TaxID=3239300 RepID=UPI003F2FA0C8
MRAHRLLLDARGRVLLTPTLRAATGLVPAMPLSVSVEDGEVCVRRAVAAAPRSPTLDRKGRLTLPGPLRRTLGLVPGATLLLRVAAPGLRLVTPARLLGRQRAARLALTEALDD